MGDWRGWTMGLAANLIASAIVYKVAGKYPAAILCALGLLLMLIVFIAGKKRETPVKDKASLAITDSFKQNVEQSPTITGPSLSNIGNPVTNIEAHIYPPLPPAPPPVRIPTPAQEIKPNIIFLPPKNITVNADHDHRTHVLTIYESPKGEFNALVLTFRNEHLPDSSRKVETLYKVTSHLVFSDAQGNEIGEGIAGAHWLNEGSANTSLVPGGQSRSLILLIKKKGSNEIVTPWKRQTKGDWTGAGLTEEGFEFNECPSSVRVRLIGSDNDLLYNLELSVYLVKGKFVAEVRRQ